MSQGLLSVEPLNFPWQTQDPFLFCAYHRDVYPKGNAQLGPNASLAGHSLGQDFNNPEGWSMYHGQTVPGFPAHPHAGFETVTVVTEGLVDHSDSLGAAGRFGGGDCQWMTAGKGVQHAEMFPLLNQQEQNPFELFQIWLNLPARSKKVEPHYKMLWKEEIPTKEFTNAAGRKARVVLYAGALDDVQAPAPNPDSWAADPANGVAIWLVQLEPGASFTLPATAEKMPRSLFYYAGNGVQVDGKAVGVSNVLTLDSSQELTLENGSEASYFLMLQGKPIEEPVATYGPFVANSGAELQQLFSEFQRTEFGGWPWDDSGPVHGNEPRRFATHTDGTEEVKAL